MPRKHVNKTRRNKIHIESYQIVKNSRLENGVLYNDEKRIIYNPDIAPYPIEQERHYINYPMVPPLEKHVHFNPHIESYPIRPIHNRVTKKSRDKMGRGDKKIKDSLLLYREKRGNKKKTKRRR